ncbi:MAG: peptidoglycan DD-metalloendopeptidase family protein [Candidatus Thiodiazotropha taylori]|nr:peptidoglycan DD-metalloendopeptidase family protein [Candidatus Thiodiazotropha taylori]
MKSLHTKPENWITALVVILLLTTSQVVIAKSAAGALKKMDRNGDGRLSYDEWRKKRIFKRIDLNGDTFLDVSELKRFFGEPLESDLAQVLPDSKTISAIRRSKFDDPQDLKDKGLVPTGLYPVWPDGIGCRGIDETYAMDYSHKRPKEAYHGGIDLPAPFGTPVLAVMDGEVVALYDAADSNPRGVEVVIRHLPEQSGLPLYLYSRYTHFDRLPELVIGQSIRMGDILGETGNSGILGCELKGRPCRGRTRRPALHFDILYSDRSEYYDTGSVLIPVNGNWMDPNALYRNSMPVDTESMKALPASEKAVSIAYKQTDGGVFPADSKAIWPYACWKK